MPVIKELNDMLDEFIRIRGFEKMKSILRDAAWDRAITFETVDEFANNKGSIYAYSEIEYFMKTENSILSMYISIHIWENKDIKYLLQVTSEKDKFHHAIALELDDNLTLNKINEKHIMYLYNVHCKICSCLHTKSARNHIVNGFII